MENSSSPALQSMELNPGGGGCRGTTPPSLLSAKQQLQAQPFQGAQRRAQPRPAAEPPACPPATSSTGLLLPRCPSARPREGRAVQVAV